MRHLLLILACAALAAEDFPNLTIPATTSTYTEGGGATSVYNNVTISDPAVYLVAGTRYYFEILHHDGSLGDHVEVGWAKPSDATKTTASQVVPSTALTSTVSGLMTGMVTRDQWNGRNLSQIPRTLPYASPADTPSSTGNITSLSVPDTGDNNFGARVYGYIVPPETGQYIFWICSDDDSEFYLSTNTSPANVRRLSSVANFVATSQDWTSIGITRYPDTLTSMLVTIGANRQTGDQLVFNNLGGLTLDSTNAASGAYTLSGSASLTTYQDALRSCQFSNSTNNPNPGAGNAALARTITAAVTDSTSQSSVGLAVTVTVNENNNTPVLTASGTVGYSEGAAGTILASGLTITDTESDPIGGATVTISNNRQTGDVLEVPVSAAYNQSYDAGTGTLTLTAVGSQSMATFQAILRTVTFRNTGADPGTQTRTVTFRATDGDGVNTNTQNVSVTVSESNDLPVVTLSTIAPPGLTYDEIANSAGLTLDNGLTITDADNTQLKAATVTIATNFQTGDVLQATGTGQISVAFDSGTHVLTLTPNGGSRPISEFVNVLRTVQFRNTGQNPGSLTRTITYSVTDFANGVSVARSHTVSVVPQNNAPTVGGSGTVNFTQGGSAITAMPNLTVADGDSTVLSTVTVAITANYTTGDTLQVASTAAIGASFNATNGVLTLSALTAAANPAAFQALLRTVTYVTASTSPGSNTRTLAVTASDGAASSSTVNFFVAVTDTPDAPIITNLPSAVSHALAEPSATLLYNNAAVTVTDPDTTTFNGAQLNVAITANGVRGVDVMQLRGSAATTLSLGSGFQVLYGGVNIGTWSQPTSANDYLRVDFNGSATLPALRAVLLGVSYDNLVGNALVDNSNRTVVLTFREGSGGPSITPFNTTLSLIKSNQKPQLSTTLVNVEPNGETVILNTNLVATDDGPLSGITYSVRTLPSQGRLLINGSVATVGSSFTHAQLTAVTQPIRYQHNGGNISADSIVFYANDGALSSDDAVLQISIGLVRAPSIISDAPLVLVTGELFTVRITPPPDLTNYAVSVSNGTVPAIGAPSPDKENWAWTAPAVAGDYVFSFLLRNTLSGDTLFTQPVMLRVVAPGAITKPSAMPTGRQ